MTTTRDNTKAGDTHTGDTAQPRARAADAPVDVPRTPTPANATDDVAARAAKQRVNPSADASWADTAAPAPNKKTVRSNHY